MVASAGIPAPSMDLKMHTSPNMPEHEMSGPKDLRYPHFVETNAIVQDGVETS